MTPADKEEDPSRAELCSSARWVSSRAVINNETWASLQFFKWMQWWCRCGGWSFKAWKKESYSLYDELGLRFASLASLGWGHSQLSREFVCLGFRHFLKFSPDIFITFSETSSNYVWTLIVSINNKIKGDRRILFTSFINYSTHCHKSILFLLNSQFRLLKMICHYFLYPFTDSILTIMVSPEMRSWLKQQV